MSGELLADVGRMAAAFGWLALAVFPVAGFLGILAGPVLPRWRIPPPTLRGFPILAFFMCYFLAMPLLMQGLDRVGFYQVVHGLDFPRLALKPNPDAPAEPAKWQQLRSMWAGLVLAPIFGMGWIGLRFNRAWSLRRWLADQALGAAVWLPLSGITLAIYFLTLASIQALGGKVDEHPLSQLTPAGDGFGGVLFLVSACLAAPFLEEFLFRGLLIPWAGRSWYRPWCLVFFAGVMASTRSASTEGNAGPLVFVGILGGGFYALTRFAKSLGPRFPVRTASAVYSSAALFASVHSSVWPSPIPLFALGLGLGWLTARTGGITAAVVCHGLFNGISTVYLLRGSTG